MRKGAGVRKLGALAKSVIFARRNLIVIGRNTLTQKFKKEVRTKICRKK